MRNRRIEIAPVAGAIGAEIHGADLARLDEATFALPVGEVIAVLAGANDEAPAAPGAATPEPAGATEPVAPEPVAATAFTGSE